MSKNHWLVEEACAALPRIRSYVHRTPLHASSWLSHACSAEVLLKLESEQITGSFKSRGAVNKVLCLTPDQIARGLVTASTGNHALAFTYATTLLKAHPQYDTTRCTIYLPSTASLAKVQKLQRKGANLQFHGNDSVQAELAALAAAEERGMVYISPYNDKQIMAGQGTIALEILEQLGVLPQQQQVSQQAPAAAASHPGAAPPDLVFVPVGGGGLIAGVAAVIKHYYPSCKVVGCQPAASDVMRQSVVAGRIVDVPSYNTLSDGTAGGVEPDALTLEPCTLFVDQWVTVSEDEIAAALVSLLHHEGKLVEGAAACAVAALLKCKEQAAGKRAALVCCGGNIAADTLSSLLASTKPMAAVQ